MRHALVGADIFTGEKFLKNHALILAGKFIADLIPTAELPPNLPTLNLGGGLLAPGFIDIQVNGGCGALLNATPDVATVQTIAKAHRNFGTTGILPTVITDGRDIMKAAYAATKTAQGLNPAILGIHCEGPFIDPLRKGAHDASFIRPLTEDDVDELIRQAIVKTLVTLAPNKASPALIKKLVSHGIIVSLGHAEANSAEAAAALKAGASCFTHLFNAMSQMNGRSPGMVGTALSDPTSFVSIIADGFHVDNVVLRATLEAKGSERVILISDAMPTAAGGPDHFLLQDRPVKLNGERLQLADGTLAGSNLTLDKAVRYCVNQLSVPLDQALLMASLNPARLLNMDDRLGRIKPTYKASLVHLDDTLNVKATWVEGAS